VREVAGSNPVVPTSSLISGCLWAAVLFSKSNLLGTSLLGAWSTESFGNDTACDWGYELEDASDLTLVRNALRKVTDTGDAYLEAAAAEEAIAAAEVLARLKGNFGQRDAYTETVDKWVAAHNQQPSPELVTLVDQALERIMRSPSELLELWQESEEFETWKGAVLDLKDRVSKKATREH
jgi:uncharacterized protein DUF4259